MERDLERLFAAQIRRIGGRTEKITAGAGTPDRLVLLPGGVMYLVELKTETGRLSPIQNLWHLRALELGTPVVVLRGAQEIRNWVHELEHGPREPEQVAPLDAAITVLVRNAPALNATQRRKLGAIL